MGPNPSADAKDLCRSRCTWQERKTITELIPSESFLEVQTCLWKFGTQIPFLKMNELLKPRALLNLLSKSKEQTLRLFKNVAL